MNGKDDIFVSVFRTMYARLFFYARSLVGNDSDADDVVQEVFIDVWHRRGDIEFGDKITSMLYRAVYTRSINTLKRHNISQKHVKSIEDINARRVMAIATHSDNPLHRLERVDLHESLSDALGKLPKKCRRVFSMSYLQNKHNEEIASELGLSLRTVEAHMYHALKILRERLKQTWFMTGE